MLALHLQWFTPAHPGGRMVGIEFGEPTRHCAGRGQICRIDQLSAYEEARPEAPAELWVDSSGILILSIPESFWDADPDSLRQWLLLPEPLPLSREWGADTSPGACRGIREKGKISFPLTYPKR